MLFSIVVYFILGSAVALIGGRQDPRIRVQLAMNVAAQRVAGIIWVPMAGSSIELVSSLWS